MTEGGLGMVVVVVGWEVGGSSSRRVEQSRKRWREVYDVCVCVGGEGGGGKDYLS